MSSSYDRDREYARNLRRFHDMTPGQWESLFTEQNGMCYLGDHPLPENRSLISIDHDHSHCARGQCTDWTRQDMHASPRRHTLQEWPGEDPHRLRVIADRLEHRLAATRELISVAQRQQPMMQW